MLFWAITQRVVLISYRNFKKTYRSHLGFHPWRWNIQAVPKLWQGITTTHCVIAQKNTTVIYFAA